MAPLGSCQDCSPAEALHPSRGEPSLGAHRASQKWYVASWNVMTLLDVEGLIETARATCVVPCLSLSPQPLPTFMAQHSLLSYRPTCLLLLLVLSQVLTSCSTPLVPVLGHIIPVLTNFHSCQIFLCQVPTSPSWTFAGPCLGQLTTLSESSEACLPAWSQPPGVGCIPNF